MTSTPSLWTRLKRARVVQVGAVYLGASWLVLQIADILVEGLSLPQWVIPVTLILLLAGMVVILATAWVQSQPATTAREAAGELPGDWEIAPRDALASLRRGRLPHLTWGRAIVGGGVVLLVFFFGLGVYASFRRGGAAFGPAEASASEAAEGIAVMPFEVRGQDLEIWREGMMDLLANSLDGVGGFRTIDTRTLMARWRSQVGDVLTADLKAMLEVAHTVGARYALEGSVVSLGPTIRLVANVYDVATGREIATGRAEGPSVDVLRLTDELAVSTMRNFLAAVGKRNSGLSMELISTSSLDAMAAFLDGERHYRRGRFSEAVQRYEAAVAADSTFAIAFVRLNDAYGWLEQVAAGRSREATAKAMRYRDRLPPRYQILLDGRDALDRASADQVANLKQAVAKYPDDPEAWFLLAETYYHAGGATYGTLVDDAWTAFEKAASLDPTFAPYLVHLGEIAVLRGDRERAESILAQYETLAGNRYAVAHIEFAIPLLLGSDEESEAAMQRLSDLEDIVLENYISAFGARHDRLDLDLAIARHFGNRTGRVQPVTVGSLLVAAGRVDEAMSLISRETGSDTRAIVRAVATQVWTVQPPPGTLRSEMCDEPAFNPVCHLQTGVALARLRQNRESERSAARLREQAQAVATTDSALSARLSAAAGVIEATAWRSGDRQRGRQLLEQYTSVPGITGVHARMELAWLEAESGRPEAAIRQFRSLLNGYTRPVALYGLALMHDQLGNKTEALQWWSRLATLTREGDDLPIIREARETLARAAREPTR